MGQGMIFASYNTILMRRSQRTYGAFLSFIALVSLEILGASGDASADCYTIRYKNPNDSKIENPAQRNPSFAALQKTAIRLRHKQINPASLCVRVNRVPVTTQPSASQSDLIYLDLAAA